MPKQKDKTDHSATRNAALSSKRGAWRGQLVRSIAGRDRGSYYLVVADSEDGFVWLADGRKRPLEHLKRKNIRHLQKVNWVHPALQAVAADQQQDQDGREITNEEVRAALKPMLKRKEGE